MAHDPATQVEVPGVAEVVELVEARAREWSGAEGPTRVELRGIDDRPQSVLVRLQIDAAGRTMPLIAKFPKASTADDREPVLVEPVRDPRRKARLEHDALVAVAEHFRALDDPRFGWVTVYAHLPDPGALIIGEVEGPTLVHFLRDQGSHRRRSAAGTVLGHLGGWLAEFHRVETPEMATRGGRAELLCDDLRRLRQLLAATGCADRLHPRLTDVIDTTIPAVVPSQLPTGLGHGDLAPRNVFVGGDLRITVIDSLGRFRVPVHEDVAYLLTELATGSARFAPRFRPPMSARALARLRSAFLDGYGLADDPTLWAFELRALMDKWRSLAQRRRGGSSPSRTKGVADALRERMVAGHVAKACERLAAW